jgi:uncharacterized protein YecE (DUF72 family)
VPLLIGTSGWQYDHWRGTFYPHHVPKRGWLEHYGARFATVESNNAFYRLPERRTFADWASRTPDDFVVAVKASRYLTHIRRLRGPGEPVSRLVGRLEGLGAKRGPVLVQLPPTLPIDLDALAATLRAFSSADATLRVAVEPRHPSWFVDGLRCLLERSGAALCLADTAGRRPPSWRTADWGYVRLHAGVSSPAPCYGRAALAAWAERIAELWPSTGDVYCYFNNDERACAVRDAHRLALAARRAGLAPTRTPGAREVRLG